MKLIKYIFFICIVWGFISCVDNSGEKQGSNDVSFALQDSIMIDYTGVVMLCDYDTATKNYLAFDYIDNTILQFNESGEIVYQFNASNDDPNGFAGSIYGLRFLTDSVVLQTRSGFFFYSKKGELIDKVPVEITGNLYTLLKFNLEITKKGQLISLMDNETNLSPMERSYYQQIKHFTILNLNNYQKRNVIPYEETSIFLNDSYYFYYSEPIFDLNPTDQKLYVNYIAERKIYVYGADFKLIQTIDTTPEHFKDPTQTPYNQKPNTLKSITYDSYYHNILSNGPYIVLEYYTGFPKTVDMPKSKQEMNNLREVHNKYYYEIFRDGEKIGNDILLPKGKFGMRYLSEDGELIFGLDNNVEERDYTIFYKYQIQVTENKNL